MKSFQIAILSFLLISASFFANAQVKSEKIKVAGECGMCKKTIESAAKKAGATYAVWNVESKELTVKYNSGSSNSAKIQKSVADAGYDTPEFSATEEAYNKLHECCKYERTDAKQASCCNNGSCTECSKDGKCSKEKECCKSGKCEKTEHAASHDAKSGVSCCRKA